MTTPQRLVVLGAGRHQAPLIRRAEERGIETIVIDYYADSPGKALATYPVLADALDVEAVAEAAERFEADGITTLGTDQTVLALATVAERLGLPCHISPLGALAATNKLEMRRALKEKSVAMTSGVTIGPAGDVETICQAMQPPFVVKAADSQGQRGMQRIERRADLVPAVALARSFSRTDTVVVEEFATGPELTLNVWFRDGRPVVIVPADRHTYNPSPAIGICLRHVVPSRFAGRRDDFDRIASGVAQGFGVTDGPLYIQMLATDDGFRVVEAAARVGGGHEAQLLAEMYQLSLIDLTIDLALGDTTRPIPDLTTDGAGIVNFVAAKPGRVESLQSFDALVDQRKICQGVWYVGVGHEQLPTTDSMGRIGAFIVTAYSRAAALDKARAVYADLWVDDDGRNLVVWPDEHQLNLDAP